MGISKKKRILSAKKVYKSVKADGFKEKNTTGLNRKSATFKISYWDKKKGSLEKLNIQKEKRKRIRENFFIATRVFHPRFHRWASLRGSVSERLKRHFLVYGTVVPHNHGENFRLTSAAAATSAAQEKVV